MSTISVLTNNTILESVFLNLMESKWEETEIKTIMSGDIKLVENLKDVQPFFSTSNLLVFHTKNLSQDNIKILTEICNTYKYWDFLIVQQIKESFEQFNQRVDSKKLKILNLHNPPSWLVDKTLETYLEYPMTIESKDYIIKSMKYKWKYINGLIADLNLEMQDLGLTQIEPAVVKKVIPRIGTVNFLNLLYNSLLGKNNSKELKRLSNYRNASKYLFNSYYNLLQELIKLKHDIYKGEVDFTTRVKYQSTNRWSDIKTEKLWNLATSLDLPFEVLYSYKHKLLEYKDTEDGLLKFLITT